MERQQRVIYRLYQDVAHPGKQRFCLYAQWFLNTKLECSITGAMRLDICRSSRSIKQRSGLLTSNLFATK